MPLTHDVQQPYHHTLRLQPVPGCYSLCRAPVGATACATHLWVQQPVWLTCGCARLLQKMAFRRTADILAASSRTWGTGGQGQGRGGIRRVVRGGH